MIDYSQLRPTDFPQQVQQVLRWSDVGADGLISHCGIARCFEDARVTLIAMAAGESGVDDVAGFLARIVIHEVSTVTWPVELTAAMGFLWVGNTSFCSATALFADGRLIAHGEAVNVCITDGRPAPVPDTSREAMMGQWVDLHSLCKDGPRPESISEVPSAPWHHIKRYVRFSDTDAIGHVNNVAVLRFYDDALRDFMHETVGTAHDFVLEITDISFQAEAHLGNSACVATAVTDIDGAVIKLRQHLYQRDKPLGVRSVTLTLSDAVQERGGELRRYLL